jgi:hypothetical protein
LVSLAVAVQKAVNRAKLLSHPEILILAIMLLWNPPGAGAAQADAPSTRDMHIDPSEEPQVQKGVDLAQRGLEWLNAGQPSATQEEQPPPDTPLGDFELYLRENAGAWYVILTKLAVAGALGLILAFVYRASYTGKKKKYSRSMMQTQLLLCIGGAFIWVLVANYLVRAFGLAGMVGLIRYRTPVRDPKDNVMVFISIGIGMSCGLSQITAAAVGTGFISLVLVGMHAFGPSRKKKKHEPEPEEEEEVTSPEVPD